MAFDPVLADRIRAALSGQRGVREVNMFGGLSFMVGGQLVASATAKGGFMVKVDPARTGELLELPGASRAVIGKRTMSAGWIAVETDQIATCEQLAFWVGEATRPAPASP